MCQRAVYICFCISGFGPRTVCVSVSALHCLVDTNKNQTEKILTGCAARFELCSDAVQPQGYIKQLTHNTCSLSASKYCRLGWARWTVTIKKKKRSLQSRGLRSGDQDDGSRTTKAGVVLELCDCPLFWQTGTKKKTQHNDIKQK